MERKGLKEMADLTLGQHEATSILAKLLASFDESFDPEGAGIGADVIEARPNGVAADLVLPSGERYRITIDRLDDHAAYENARLPGRSYARSALQKEITSAYDAGMGYDDVVGMVKTLCAGEDERRRDDDESGGLA